MSVEIQPKFRVHHCATRVDDVFVNRIVCSLALEFHELRLFPLFIDS